MTIAVQTRLDSEIILWSGLKIWDWTAYKSVQSGPVLVSWSGLVSLPRMVGLVCVKGMCVLGVMQ